MSLLILLAACTTISDAEVTAKVGGGADGDGSAQVDSGDTGDTETGDDTDTAADSDTDTASPDADGDGYTLADGDCDDADSLVNPGAVEVCNGIDDDCDDSVDPAISVDAPTWYIDYDADGYGSTSFTDVGCAAPGGYVGNASDCDDTDATDYPGATETCDGDDDDCDGTADEDDAVDAPRWYADADGDSFGDAATSVVTCAAPPDYIANNTDCDDTNAGHSPDAVELCDGDDDDCDGAIDEDDAVDALTWYIDVDGDLFGDATVAVSACAEPLGYVADATDCDDGDAATYPGASEACDADDDDCDGRTDNDAPCDFPVEFNDDAACTSYGNAYIFVNWTYSDPEIWTDAVAYCQSFGYEPLVVDDVCEWDWFAVASPGREVRWWWTGLYCASGACTSTADFVWIDGSAGYVGEWRGTGSADYDCAYISGGSGYFFASPARCDEQYAVICEAP